MSLPLIESLREFIKYSSLIHDDVFEDLEGIFEEQSEHEIVRFSDLWSNLNFLGRWMGDDDVYDEEDMYNFNGDAYYLAILVLWKFLKNGKSHNIKDVPYECINEMFQVRVTGMHAYITLNCKFEKLFLEMIQSYAGPLDKINIRWSSPIFNNIDVAKFIMALKNKGMDANTIVSSIHESDTTYTNDRASFDLIEFIVSEKMELKKNWSRLFQTSMSLYMLEHRFHIPDVEFCVIFSTVALNYECGKDSKIEECYDTLMYYFPDLFTNVKYMKDVVDLYFSFIGSQRCLQFSRHYVMCGNTGIELNDIHTLFDDKFILNFVVDRYCDRSSFYTKPSHMQLFYDCVTDLIYMGFRPSDVLYSRKGAHVSFLCRIETELVRHGFCNENSLSRWCVAKIPEFDFRIERKEVEATILSKTQMPDEILSIILSYICIILLPGKKRKTPDVREEEIPPHKKLIKNGGS